MEKEKKACGKRMEIYSRIVGYFRPVSNWNGGKKAEFKDRLEYDVAKSMSTKEVVSPISIRTKTASKTKVKVPA